ncbi:MAG: efflux RND transporter periplasmic adaptor subunit [Akkermansiaceae bacterium]|nr:efflux RND transporter periplasmic adaptor subunit [Akkermansiaceae bacterium]
MKLALKIIIPFVFIALAGFGVSIMIKNKKGMPAGTPPLVVPQAEVISVNKQDHQPPVITYGTVQSYFETTLTPQVGGQIVDVAKEFHVGHLVKKGTVLARIDDADYVAALARETSNLSTAKRTLAEEEIKAKQAAEDWIASGRDLATASDFVLRKPQLAAAKASIQSTEAAVKKAEVDVQRTIIRAPYDAVVLTRTASLGNYAGPQQSLGKLVATERVEIRLPLTADQVARVNLPGLGAQDSSHAIQVTLTSATREGVQWNGRLTRTEPAVDAKNQVAYVIAEVDSPYVAEPEPLVVGTFVNASIPAKTIPGAYKAPESALVNDSYVWVLDKADQLCRISATRVHSYNANVYLQLSVDDLAEHAISLPLRIVTRPLTNFKQGEKVKPVSKDD